MPSSSRRKQSKPQHFTNDKGHGENAESHHPVTSVSTTTGSSHFTQEYQCKSLGILALQIGRVGNQDMVNGIRTDCNENGNLVLDQAASPTGEAKTCATPLLPSDSSSNVKVTGIRSDLVVDGTSLVAEYCPPFDDVKDQVCMYCNKIMDNTADLHLHLQKHREEPVIKCNKCSLSFKSKCSLEHHMCMEQHLSSANCSIAESILVRLPSPAHKRFASISSTETGQQPYLTDTNSSLLDLSSSQLPLKSFSTEMASKRQKLVDVSSPTNPYSSAINLGTSHTTTDTHRSNDEAHKGTVSEILEPKNGQCHTCGVCCKVFPKPSDLKRHMMCHTGEKPFRCKYCFKPFRAKSSMHYHLKATHGIEIELSPGLEERYLRMKTRAQMYLVNKNHLTAGLPRPYVSESPLSLPENNDTNEIDDNSNGNELSVNPNVRVGADFTLDLKSQGFLGHTGNDLKLALDLSTSDKNKELDSGLHAFGTLREIDINYSDMPAKRSKLSVNNETILVTRLDGVDLISGENISVYKCYLCNGIFPSPWQLQCHLSTHFERWVLSYQCCFCEDQFRFKSQLQNHVKGKHLSELFGLDGHMKLDETGDRNPETLQFHGEQQPNKCSCHYCHKNFNSMASLQRHVRLHVLNRNCYCRICGKTFNHYTSLQSHISRLHWRNLKKSRHTLLPMKQKLNFFHTPLFKPKFVDDVPKQSDTEPLNLMSKKSDECKTKLADNSMRVFMSQSPTCNGNISNACLSHNSSSANVNWSESVSNQPQDGEDDEREILTATQRSLMTFCRDGSPRRKLPRKSDPYYIPNQNQSTLECDIGFDIPLNFTKKANTFNQDGNNNDSVSSVSSHSSQQSPDHTSATPCSETLIPQGYSLNAANHMLMAKALAAHQTIAEHFSSTSQAEKFPPNHLSPNLLAMTQMMSMPINIPMMSDNHDGTASKSPSPSSHTSSKSDTSPEDRDSKEGIKERLGRMYWGQDTNILPEDRDSKEGIKERLGMMYWGQDTTNPVWSFNTFSPQDLGHADGRKVTSLSRTHSRLGIVQSPINRVSMCKPTALPDGRTVYKCPFCIKEFLSFSDINRHMDFHEDIRPYKCQYCDYYARTNSQLKVHMMRHQGIREFCCKLCNYKGVTQSDLNRHMKSQIHMLKSRNACSYCGEGFVTSKNLEKHLDGNCIIKVQRLNGELESSLQETVA